MCTESISDILYIYIMYGKSVSPSSFRFNCRVNKGKTKNKTGVYSCPLHRPLFFSALKSLYATLGIHVVSKGELHLNSAHWNDVLPTDA